MLNPSDNIHRVPKGWGYEVWFANKPEYCGKLLHFNKGKFCSFHYHKEKDETFYLHSGLLRVVFGQDDDLANARDVLLSPGDSFYVPPGLRHQMVALEDSDLYEVSTQHFEEDSIRVVKGN